MPILTAVVGDGLGAWRARDTLGRCEVFGTHAERDLRDVPGSGPEAARRWAELLDSPEIELLVLAVPPEDRVALSRAARAAGKAVLLEEGPPLSLTELDQLAEDDVVGEAPMGMVLPLRGLLTLDHALTRIPWTALACGGLLVSTFAPDLGPPPGQGRALRPVTDRVRPASRAALDAVSPYLDLVCQLFGEPVTAGLEGLDTGVAAGSVAFAFGARLSLVVTVRSVISDMQLRLTDTERSVVLHGRELWVEDASGVMRHPVPPPGELRMSSYLDMARALRSGAATCRHSPQSTRLLADCLALLRT
ncbi:hypothetical protein C3492_39100 [Streptomyces sp. Ru62]|uniref:hypothetical protein n=1 Tax=Streptomyces sp. Ru62 TaxID=2080745 RepID=UPI000CDD256D|nr:hypothetical protein [Streptomyces sp. Ru62]POX58194.1 hypothetical protein C3492_39100 [Streptomyces sp. Ru62]